MKKQIKKTERGWAGHFICASDCMFRRNTLVEYGKKAVVVSTVGLMLRQDDQGNFGDAKEIGYDRYYETMSFMADGSVYKDADVSLEVNPSGVKWSINGKEMKERKSDIDNVANDMHEKYVKAIEDMLINGEI